MLSNQALTVLKAHGWSESRHHDYSAYELFYDQAGCPLPTCVKSFLAKYGGIDIVIKEPLSQTTLDALNKARKHLSMPLLVSPQYDLRTIKINATNANFVSSLMTRIDFVFSQFEYFKKRVNAGGFWYIGEYKSIMNLIMSDIGCIYAFVDDDLWFVADMGESALNALIENKVFEEIT